MPEGFVLTVEGVGRIPPSGGPVPADVRAALASALDTHGDGQLAVRSSGVAEDLAGASFAGQYESVLGVRGLEELVSAISRCRASDASERVTAYHAPRDRARPAPAHARLLIDARIWSNTRRKEKQ